MKTGLTSEILFCRDYGLSVGFIDLLIIVPIFDSALAEFNGEDEAALSRSIFFGYILWKSALSILPFGIAFGSEVACNFGFGNIYNFGGPSSLS